MELSSYMKVPSYMKMPSYMESGGGYDSGTWVQQSHASLPQRYGRDRAITYRDSLWRNVR